MTVSTLHQLIGHTPSGAPFTLSLRSLSYGAHDGVGPIGIPLRMNTNLTALHEELTRTGSVSAVTRKNCFAC